MLPSNIEEKVREIINKYGKGGWLRTEECAKLVSEGNNSNRTRFYRWRKKVESGDIKGFQIIKFTDNVSFIGLDSSSPKKLQELEKTRGPHNFFGQGMETKEVEKTEDREELNLEIRIRQCKMEIRRLEREYYRTQPQKNRNTQIPFDVQVEIEKKCRKKYGLSTKEPL